NQLGNRFRTTWVSGGKASFALLMAYSSCGTKSTTKAVTPREKSRAHSPYATHPMVVTYHPRIHHGFHSALLRAPDSARAGERDGMTQAFHDANAALRMSEAWLLAPARDAQQRARVLVAFVEHGVRELAVGERAGELQCPDHHGEHVEHL